MKKTGVTPTKEYRKTFCSRIDPIVLPENERKEISKCGTENVLKYSAKLLCEVWWIQP